MKLVALVLLGLLFGVLFGTVGNLLGLNPDVTLLAGIAVGLVAAPAVVLRWPR